MTAPHITDPIAPGSTRRATVFTQDSLGTAPDWVELEGFEHFTLDQTQQDSGIRTLSAPTARTEVLMVLTGSVSVETATGRVTLHRRDWMVIPPGGAKIICQRASGEIYHAELMRFWGTWTQLNICTIFQYRPERELEIHYHDFQEYWIVYRGHFEGVFDDQVHDFRPGEVLAIPVGHEHGTRKRSTEVFEGVGFSTARVGRQRQGHLHRETDGDPIPA